MPCVCVRIRTSSACTMTSKGRQRGGRSPALSEKPGFWDANGAMAAGPVSEDSGPAFFLRQPIVQSGYADSAPARTMRILYGLHP